MLTVILLCSCIGNILTACPEVCDCNESNVGCFAKNLTEVPGSIKDVSAKRIDLRYNRVQCLRANTFYNGFISTIQVIFLNTNDISNIDENAFAGLTTVTELYLRSNKIKTLLKSTFAPLVRLTYLDLSNNPLNKIVGTSFTVPPLITINMKNCSIERFEDVFRPQVEDDSSWLRTVKHLLLGSNSISELSEKEVSMLRSVSQVSMAGNPLHCNSITKAQLEAKGIECNFIDTTSWMPPPSKSLNSTRQSTEDSYQFPQETSTTTIRLLQKGFSKPQKQVCNGRLMTHSESNGMDSAAYDYSNIYLVHTRTCKFQKNATTLLLNNNRIKMLHLTIFNELTNLVKLDLSSNRLTHVPEKIFSSNINLEWLSLANNSLFETSAPLFSKLPLRYLNISHNPIYSFPSKVAWGSQLQILDVSFTNVDRIPEHTLVFFQSLKTVHISVFNGVCYDEVERIMQHRKGLSSSVCYNCTAGCCESQFFPIARSRMMDSKILQIAIILSEMIFTISCIVYVMVDFSRKGKQLQLGDHIYETVREESDCTCI